MSDEAVVPPSVPEHPSSPAVTPSFLQQYRFHLIGAGAVILIAIFFMAGIAVGMSKRNFEKKFYLDQIDKLKTTLSSAVGRQEELNQEIKELKIDLRAKKDHVADLEEKVADLERKAEKHGEVAASPHVAPQAESGAVAAGSTGDAGLDYVRLKAGDCVVDGSSSATAAKWRECLKNAKKTPETKH